MKAIKEIEAEIATLVSFVENNYKKDSPKMFTREKGRMAFLRHVILFLETNPSEDYMRREAARLDKLITSLESQYETWTKNTPPDAPPNKFKSVFNKEMGLTLLRLQRKTAYFILND
jgi:hypothetical protein